MQGESPGRSEEEQIRIFALKHTMVHFAWEAQTYCFSFFCCISTQMAARSAM